LKTLVSPKYSEPVRKIPAGFLLIVMVLIAYIPAMRAGYVWDDDDTILNNENLRTAAGLWTIWTDPSRSPQGDYYWPLVYTTFWLEYQFWGIQPLGYHLSNIILHGVNCLLLWSLLHLMKVPGAWLAAAIFALHPVHVASVAWITERKNVLAGLFYLGSSLSYTSHDWKQHLGKYILSVILFICAMLSKTISVSLPLAILLYLWWKKNRLEKRDIVRLIPFCIIAILLATLGVRMHMTNYAAPIELSIVDRFLIAGRAIWFYAGKILVPLELMAIYPQWKIDSTAFVQYLFPVGVAVVLFLLWFLRDRIGKGPLVAVLYFCVTSGPILGFVDFSLMDYAYVQDHLQYLASIGLIALTAAGLSRGAQYLFRYEQSFGFVGAGALLIALGFLTWNQAKTYKNKETLFSHNIRLNPEAWIAQYNLGNAQLARENWKQAIEYYTRAIRIKPDHVDARNNLALALEAIGRKQDALDHLLKALELRPDSQDTHYNIGSLFNELGNTESAKYHLLQAVKYKPDFPQAHTNLALCFIESGEYARAIASFTIGQLEHRDT
jgi:hypothetical protein